MHSVIKVWVFQTTTSEPRTTEHSMLYLDRQFINVDVVSPLIGPADVDDG